MASSSPEIWGAEHSLLDIARSLGSDGVTVDLYARCQELIDEWMSSGVGTATLVPRRSSPWADFACALKGGPARDARLLLFNLDLLPLAWIRSAAKACTVLDLHDALPSAAGRRKLRILTARVSRVVAVSDYVSRQLTSRQRARCVVLHRSVNRADASVSGEASRRYGLIGRLDEDKRLGFAVQAFEHAPKRAQLVVRGAPLMSSSAESAAAVDAGMRSLGDRLVFEGQVPRRDSLSGLRAVIVCRKNEPLGRTVLEAHAHGLPVVVPDSGGAQELVRHGIDGLVYSADDPLSLAAAVRKLEDPGLYVALAAGAWSTAGSRPAHREYARRYLDAAAGVGDRERRPVTGSGVR